MLIEIPRKPRAEKNLWRLTLPGIIAKERIDDFMQYESQEDYYEPNMHSGPEQYMEEFKTYQIELKKVEERQAYLCDELREIPEQVINLLDRKSA